MKIDILDDYIQTPEWFRGLSDIYQSTGGLPEPPRGLLGLMGPKWWKRRGSRRWRAAPLAPIQIDKGEGARPAFSFLLSTSSFPLLLVGIGKGGKTYLE